jgi:anti-sigma-K factor RskA
MRDHQGQLRAGDDERLFDLCIQLELGMLDHAERDEITDLLEAQNPAALAAQRLARETLGAVGESVGPVVPPPELKQRVFDGIEEPAPEVSAEPPQQAEPSIRIPRWAALGWAAAAALAAFVFVSNQQSAELRRAVNVIEERQAALEQANDRYRKLFAILAAPGARTVWLESPDRPAIRVVWSDRMGLALATEGLAAPARGRAYQLWAIPDDGVPVSIEIFRPDADERALIFANPAIVSAECQALTITEEDAGGADQPASDPIWTGLLR